MKGDGLDIGHGRFSQALLFNLNDGRGLWRQMKIGASAPFTVQGAGTQILAAILSAQQAAGKSIKLHLVGHSTGAILHAHLVKSLVALAPGIRIASVSLLAPAATNDLFKHNFRPLLKAPKSQAGIDRMTIYNLTEKLECDDNVVNAYRKSLLCLVSCAFEEDPRPAKILGLERYNKGLATSLSRLRFRYSEGDIRGARYTASESHGGFDNDVLTMNDVLRTVLGKSPTKPFTAQSLKY